MHWLHLNFLQILNWCICYPISRKRNKYLLLSNDSRFLCNKNHGFCLASSWILNQTTLAWNDSMNLRLDSGQCLNLLNNMIRLRHSNSDFYLLFMVFIQSFYNHKPLSVNFWDHHRARFLEKNPKSHSWDWENKILCADIDYII